MTLVSNAMRKTMFAKPLDMNVMTSKSLRPRVIAEIDELEPLLRVTCTHEIDSARPVAQVVEELLAIEDLLGESPV